VADERAGDSGGHCAPTRRAAARRLMTAAPSPVLY
jgi:hypothetical protein